MYGDLLLEGWCCQWETNYWQFRCGIAYVYFCSRFANLFVMDDVGDNASNLGPKRNKLLAVQMWYCICLTSLGLAQAELLGYLFRKLVILNTVMSRCLQFHKVSLWIKWGDGKVGSEQLSVCHELQLSVVSFHGYNLGFSKALKNVFHPLLLYYYLNCQ